MRKQSTNGAHEAELKLGPTDAGRVSNHRLANFLIALRHTNDDERPGAVGKGADKFLCT
jgi:hypothetical protein